MARPQKAVAEYFPHYASGGKTMFIVESKFGNDGYAVWFKILELLACTENHYYDCRNPDDWEFLLAKTRLSGVIVTEILDLLARLGAINPEFWQKKIIRSDNLIKNLESLYSRRKISVISNNELKALLAADEEQKAEKSSNELLYTETPLSGINVDIMRTETPLSGISVDINPQSKVKESKVKESKLKERDSYTTQKKESSTHDQCSSSDKSDEPTRRPKKSRTVALVDDEFLNSLKSNAAYDGIDIVREHGKLLAWLQTPRGLGKLPTKQRFINWLNRCTPQDKTSISDSVERMYGGGV